jgi:hypothetical protein
MKLIKFSYLLLSVFSINFSLAQNCDLPPNFTGNTGYNMSIFLAATFISSLNATDENASLVALTNSGLVVGSTSIYGLSQSSIALWSDDSQTPEIDGALANEVISFQLVNGTDLYDVSLSGSIVYVVNDLILLISPAVTTLVECNASVYGCTDATAFNYNNAANTDDNSCIEVIEGCTDATAFNYNNAANTDDNSCIEVIEGCTDATAFNYNNTANTDDNSCIEVIEGCTDATACNYNAVATDSDVCIFTDGICETCSGEQDGTGTVLDNDTDSDGVCDSDEIQGCTDTAACNYNAAATDSDDDLCYILTVVIDTSSLSSVLTAIVSPADSVVTFSWLYNGAEVGIDSTYTASENGVYSVRVSNSTCDASASFEIQYVSLHELNSLVVNLYPNPFKDVINIEFIKATSNIEFRILNTLGEEVKYEKIVQNRDGSEIQIQVSDLPKGMYILRVNSGNYLNSFVLIKN